MSSESNLRIDEPFAFIVAARDFYNAGPDKFKPGYEQYGDLLASAEQAAALSRPQAPAGGGEGLAGRLRALADDCRNTDGWESAAEDVETAADLLSPTQPSEAEVASRAFAAMQKFCNRVDAGEVRSKRTYAEFKEILALSAIRRDA